MVEKARNPSMAIFIFHFGVVVLSAFGLDALTDSVALPGPWPRRIMNGVLIFSALLWAALLMRYVTNVTAPIDVERIAVTAFVGLLLALALHARTSGTISPKAAGIVFLLLIVFELGNVTGHFWAHKQQGQSLLKPMYEAGDLVTFLKRRPGPVRVEIKDEDIHYNFGDWNGVDTFDGYVASVPVNVYRVWFEHRARMLLSVNYSITKKPAGAGQFEVFSDANGLKVYQNPEAFPRVWSVHEAVGLGSESEIFSHLQKTNAELRQYTFLFGAPPTLQKCAAEDDIRLVQRDTNRVIIDADMKCKGMVIASEVFFPGWESTVDGKATPTYEAYSVLRGAVVEAGRHRIEMRYRPNSVFVGGALTILGLAGVCLLTLCGSMPLRDEIGLT
jgi:hypothetical protein